MQLLYSELWCIQDSRNEEPADLQLQAGYDYRLKIVVAPKANYKKGSSKTAAGECPMCH